MAELVGILASAATIAELGAQSSLALFKVISTIKNAREEISQIAAEMSDLSGTVVMLQHLLESYRHVYTTTLLDRVRSILQRFDQVDKDLKKLTGKKKKLKSLRWFFEGPKAKGLLRKVEGIKSSLSLVINIILLAADQASRVGADKNPYRQSGNPFRKIAETVVQTHRLAIERAEKESTSNPTEKRRQYNSGIQRWQADSHDTATWLYQLVFASKNPEPTTRPTVPVNSKGLEGPRHATVRDEDEEQASLVGQVDERSEESVAPPEQSSELILWTEPGPVLDMLLESWTHLSLDQIQASKVFHPSRHVRTSDAWTSGLEQRVLEYEQQERDKQRDDFESRYRQNSQRWNSSIKSNSNSEGVSTSSNKPLNPATRTSDMDWQYKGTSENSSDFEDSLSDGSSEASGAFDHIEELHGTGAPGRPAARDAPVEPRKREHDQHPNFPTSNPFAQGFNAPVPPSYPPPTSNPQNPYGFRTTHPQVVAPIPNYFAPPPYHSSYPQPYQSSFPYQHYPTEKQSSATPRRASPVTAPLPPPPPLPSEDKNSLLAMLEKRLSQHQEKNQAHSERMDDLRNRILEEQISQLQSDRDTEERHPAAEDNIMDNESFLRLENLLLEQRLEQVKRFEETEAAWKAERVEADAGAAKASEEANRLIEKEIFEAKAAKKAAEDLLEFGKEQAAKQARQEAEAKATEERRRVQDDYEARIKDYEDRLDSFTQQWQAMMESQSHSAAPMPFRHTRVSQGNRRVEVSEFAGGFQRSTSRPFDPAMLVNRGMGKAHGSSNGLATNHFRTPPISSDDWPSKFTAQITRQGEDKIIEESRGVVLFNARFDKASTKTRELREFLNNGGLLTTSDEFEYGGDMHAGLAVSEFEMLHSTLFWEPPVLTLGSELLATLRGRDWKPIYIRGGPAGQTYFHGDQPVHVHFFRPEYKPQLIASSISSDTEYVMIGKDLVEEYALLELGYQFQSTVGAYALDCRLTPADIEALIGRSFTIKETNFRRLHRQLQWTPYDSGTVATEDGSETSSTSDNTTTTSWVHAYREDDSQSEIDIPPAPSAPTSPVSTPDGGAPRTSYVAELRDINLIDL